MIFLFQHLIIGAFPQLLGEMTLTFSSPDPSIDGVLLRSSEPIPGARESIQFLQDNNIPYTLLTNGGGVHEVEKAADVSEKLGVKIPGHLVVVSHSPFQDLAQGNNNLETKPVFVTGSNPEKCREIAERWESSWPSHKVPRIGE